MKNFCKKNNLKYMHFNSDKALYERNYSDKALDIYSLNNNLVAVDKSMRISQFIRDPRDLIVSGYHYHKWTEEAWCRDRTKRFTHILNDATYQQYIGSEHTWEEGESYQDFINKLSSSQGMILEIIWRKGHFDTMLGWDLSLENFIRMKYEDIIDNEEEMFDKLYAHYQLPEKLKGDFLTFVTKFSRKNATLSQKSHTRNGNYNQWVNEFDELTGEVFNQFYSITLKELGYE
jgi:hypothetical protein